MANQEHVKILSQGVEVWNKWREEHRNTRPDLSDADLSDADLRAADLRAADLNGTDLRRADLRAANLIGADLSEADLNGTDLRRADLGDVDLMAANLIGADLSEASLIGANLNFADLRRANLTNCKIFGVSVWMVNLDGAKQKNLVITIEGDNEPNITVDNIEVAQFIYLLLNNSKIRDVIDTITAKVVLILGRFTDERKPVLDALRDELRNYNYTPVVFDFEPSEKRDLTETISLLARMSRFVIADLTDAKSIPQELENIVPHLPSVPVQPILQMGNREYAMFEHYEWYPWVLPIHQYRDIPSLLASVKEHIITPVEKKEREKDKMKVLEEENSKLREEVEKLKGGK